MRHQVHWRNVPGGMFVVRVFDPNLPLSVEAIQMAERAAMLEGVCHIYRQPRPNMTPAELSTMNDGELLIAAEVAFISAN